MTARVFPHHFKLVLAKEKLYNHFIILLSMKKERVP